MTGLRPYLVDSWVACQQAAPQILNDIENSMLHYRPDSDYMLVAIRIYCFLVDLPVGKSEYIQINRRPYIEDVDQHADDNLCLFRCIVKKHRPLENEEDRELRVNLM